MKLPPVLIVLALLDGSTEAMQAAYERVFLSSPMQCQMAADYADDAECVARGDLAGRVRFVCRDEVEAARR